MSRTGMDSGVMESAWPVRRASGAEGAAAAAGCLRVGVVEHEAPCQQRRVVVERRALQEHVALPVDEDLGAMTLEHFVAKPRHLLPAEHIAQSRAAAALHADTQTTIGNALLGHQRFDLLRRVAGYLNHDLLDVPGPKGPGLHWRESYVYDVGRGLLAPPTPRQIQLRRRLGVRADRRARLLLVLLLLVVGNGRLDGVLCQYRAVNLHRRQ